MSAVLDQAPQLEPMTLGDLEEVLCIERAVYTHPWSRLNFADSLQSGYSCLCYRAGGELIGYCVLVVAVGEAHLLNLSIAAQWQRKGYGAALLGEVLRVARGLRARHLFLEVRPSNLAGLALYASFRFRQLSLRRNYYPGNGEALEGREDALVLTLDL